MDSALESVAVVLSALSLAIAFATARQVGRALTGGSLPDTAITDGPILGSRLGLESLIDAWGVMHPLGTPARGTVLIMSRTTCSVCASLRPELAAFARRWPQQTVALLESGLESPPGDEYGPLTAAGGILVDASDDHRWLNVRSTPHVIVLSGSGEVLANQVAPSVAHLDAVLSSVADSLGSRLSPSLPDEDGAIGREALNAR